jgi:Raf kinase inhibitor-like YbhB/YbcL family protein
MALHLKSHDFKNGQPIPSRFTFQGKSISPHLRWAGAPPETQEFALICEDPDAPTPKPIVHWMIYGISSKTHTLPRGLKKKSLLRKPVEAKQGKNSFLFRGWLGPNPNFWHHGHRYQFKLLALNRKLSLAPGAGRGEFLEAVHGHVIEQAHLEGTYEKTRFQKGKAVVLWGSLIALAAVGISSLKSRKE